MISVKPQGLVRMNQILKQISPIQFFMLFLNLDEDLLHYLRKAMNYPKA